MSFFSIWSHKKKNLLFTIWIMFWDIGRIYFFFFNIQNIKSNSVSHIYIIFLKFFPIIFFWWKIYSFPVIFQFLLFFAYLCWVLHDLTQALQRIENILLSFLLMRFIAAFLFLSNQENYIWSTKILVYLMTFLTQEMNMIKYTLPPFHWFQIILISIFKWIKKFFHNFTCFIIHCDFYIVIFWMYYMLFIIFYGRNKGIWYC